MGTAAGAQTGGQNYPQSTALVSARALAARQRLHCPADAARCINSRSSPGFGQEGQLALVAAQHNPGLLAVIILVTAGKLTLFAVAHKGHGRGFALVSDPVAGVYFLAGQGTAAGRTFIAVVGSALRLLPSSRASARPDVSVPSLHPPRAGEKREFCPRFPCGRVSGKVLLHCPRSPSQGRALRPRPGTAFFEALARLAFPALGAPGGGDWAGGASAACVSTPGPVADAAAGAAGALAGRLGAVFW